jgi:3-hydroxyisobutyrate dehydrogenase
MRVGVIGLGNMGEGMATNVVRKGFETTVRDLRREPVQRLVAAGARAAETNVEVGRRSDVVMVVVFDEGQVRACLEPTSDDEGVLAGLSPGSIVCVTSTVSPTTVRSLAERARADGVAVIDVAMSGGGDVAATAGALTFMVGGDAEVLARCREVLGAMATTIHHVGTIGSGVTAKIVNNLLAVENVASVREALSLSKALGFEEAEILEIVRTAVGASWVSDHWEQIRTQEQGHTLGTGGIAAMAEKDLYLALDLGRQVGLPMPLLDRVVTEIVPDLKARGMTADG